MYINERKLVSECGIVLKSLNPVTAGVKYVDQRSALRQLC